MSELAVAIENLTYRFGANNAPALDGISVTFAKGTINGVIGPDGAGKTTLMRTLQDC